MNRRDFSKAGLGAAGLAVLGPGSALAAGPTGLIMKAIPSSNEELPVIGLGTNRFGVGKSSSARAPVRAVLQYFHKLGGSFIDTAPQYRGAESVLGDLISEFDVRDDLFLATKTDRRNTADTAEQLGTSSEKLLSRSLDLMQVHNLRGWKTALPVMRQWKQDGRLRYIGITTSKEKQYPEFEAIMREQALDFIQINYSMSARVAEQRILPLAADLGLAVVANQPFSGGKTLRAVGRRPRPAWCKEFGCRSWPQFLLKYVVSHPAVTVAIPGTTKLHHVSDNLGAMLTRLPNADERQRQEDLFDSL